MKEKQEGNQILREMQRYALRRVINGAKQLKIATYLGIGDYMQLAEHDVDRIAEAAIFINPGGLQKSGEMSVNDLSREEMQLIA